MVQPVSNTTLVRPIAGSRNLVTEKGSQFKNLVSLRDFNYGRTLLPQVQALFAEKYGQKVADVQVDRRAKIGVIAMEGPSFMEALGQADGFTAASFSDFTVLIEEQAGPNSIKIILLREPENVAMAKNILEPENELAEQIGVNFKRIEGGGFFYQGKRAEIEAFEASETLFTIGMMKKLLAIKGDEVREIFKYKDWSVDKVIGQSLAKTAADVPTEEKENCPLVYVNKREAAGIAELVGCDLLTERQWERAASGRDGKKRPWGNTLDSTKAVYNDSGTRPVKSKPAGVSAEGLFDLIGDVWEWTKESFLRGGSWRSDDPGYLQADYRRVNRPENRGSNGGFRFARIVR